jgi:superoxide reductase
MSKIPKFYQCLTCGRIIEIINDSNSKLLCCNQPMTELIPNSSSGATEKHIPVIERDGDKVIVKVSSVAHPMTKEHYIQWVQIQTESGEQRHSFDYNDIPEVTFHVKAENVITVFAYCNLHGLWQNEN